MKKEVLRSNILELEFENLSKLNTFKFEEVVGVEIFPLTFILEKHETILSVNGLFLSLYENGPLHSFRLL